MADEVGWLIERRDGKRIMWMSLRIVSMGSWEYDASYGLRFARESDANEYVRARGLPDGPYEIFVTEHKWPDAKRDRPQRSPQHEAFMERVGRKYPHLRDKAVEDD